ncbi:MAG TPA: hypothetical protein VLK85_35485 [Ramlibacter sp.]|nr:hypothetical protein [Ramlibacter sp.]
MSTPSIEPRTAPQLPAAFADLAAHAAWCLPTETERNRRRNASTLAELLAFRDAILPRVDAIVRHLNGFPLAGMPPAQANLMHMLLSLAEIAPAVECYHQPGVPDGYDPARFVADEQFVMRPPI